MKMFWFLLFLLSPIYSYGQSATPDGMGNLRSLLKAGTIRRVEILRIPDDVMTRTAVTPEAIRSIASYKVIFNEGFQTILIRCFPRYLSVGLARTLTYAGECCSMTTQAKKSARCSSIGLVGTDLWIMKLFDLARIWPSGCLRSCGSCGKSEGAHFPTCAEALRFEKVIGTE